MTETDERLLSLIYEAIDEMNEELPPERQIEKKPDEVLMGKSGKLDSLLLVSLVVAVEQRITDVLGVSVTLADERAISQKSSPFRTVGALTGYAAQLIAEAKG